VYVCLCEDKSGVISAKKSYWNYLCECLASNKYLKDGVHFVRSLTEVGLTMHCRPLSHQLIVLSRTFIALALLYSHWITEC